MALLSVGLVASAYVLAVPFHTSAVGGPTVPTVLAAGVAVVGFAWLVRLSVLRTAGLRSSEVMS